MEFEGSSAGAVRVKQALADVATALDDLTGDPWWALSEAEVAAAVVELHRLESRVAAAQVGALGEVIDRGLPIGAGAPAAGAWLRGLVPVTPSQAKARAALAAALPRTRRTPIEGEPDHDLTPTRAAFDAGAITPAQTGVLVRTSAAIDAVPADDGRPGGVDAETRREALGVLLDFADRLDVAQLGKAAARARYLLDRDAARRLARDEDAQQDARGSYLVEDPMTGMWHGELTLPPVEGAIVNTALEVLAKPEPAEDGTPDPRSAKQRHADAFVALARLGMCALPGEPGALPSRGGSPVRLVATADLATLKADLRRRHGGAGVPPATVETGQPAGQLISPMTAQLMACDAEIVPLLTDESGRPLDVGTTIYPFPRRIRRAMEHRDRHCTFPGCGAPPSRCHAHHLIRHPDGPTSEDNGTLLCGRHHRHVHAKGWRGRIVDGHVAWRPPGRGDPADEADELMNAHTQQVERALNQLALRWLARNPELRDTG